MIMHLHKIIFMVKEEKKFLAEVYKICGFALMTPLAQYFLISYDLKITYLNVFIIGHFLVSFALFCFGCIMIQRAYEMVQE